MQYIGRFAPSPTGPLHLGSLYAALASFLHARSNQGQWLLRIDDLDSYRNVIGAADSITQTLQIYGLIWDGAVHYQSADLESYQTVIQHLTTQDLVYPCNCTRKALAALNSRIYSGNCRIHKPNVELPHALRIKTKNRAIQFEDQLQGQQIDNMATQQGDFIVKRKDKIIAYQLAVVIDDAIQNISHVVRGYDLLDSTFKQIFLQQTLGYSTPEYCHVPIITDKNGDKLSKQTFAQAVSSENPHQTLFLLLDLLKQNPPNELKNASVSNLLSWGIEHWNPHQLKNIRTIF